MNPSVESNSSFFRRRRTTVSFVLVLCALISNFGLSFFKFHDGRSVGLFYDNSKALSSYLPTGNLEGLRPATGDLSFLNATENVRNTSLFSLQDPSTSPPFAVFYNIYIPRDKGQEAIERSLAVVDDQMAQVGESYAASHQNKPVNVFFNTIGQSGILNNTYMAQVCSDRSNMRCIHMKHYDEGFEDLTLQRLYEYCHRQSDPDHRVVYMHNKGSFHPSSLNHWWRRHMTMAATNELCLNPTNLTCSTCGLIFFGVWALMYPGNVFTAECSYVRKLHPPNRFGEKVEKMFELRRKKNEVNPAYKLISPNHTILHEFGQGRYGHEFWIASHPSMVPCDLSGELLFEGWAVGPRDPSNFSLALFPRPPLKLEKHYLIAGNLFKHFALYNEAPPDDSWTWTKFPDGPRWHRAVKKYGNQTIDVLMKEKWLSDQNETRTSRSRLR